jgi:hypothetical protein
MKNIPVLHPPGSLQLSKFIPDEFVMACSLGAAFRPIANIEHKSHRVNEAKAERKWQVTMLRINRLKKTEHQCAGRND